MTARRFARPRLEVLEGREVPANLAVSFSPLTHTLTVVGDADANDLTVQPDPTDATRFVLASDSDAIRGQREPYQSPTGVQNISLSMLGGDDVVTLDSTTTSIHLAGSLTVNGGDGANTVTTTVGVDRSNGLTVGGNLSITNGTNATGKDETELNNLSAGGNVTIRNGDGDTATNIYRFSDAFSTIGGNLTITDGTGLDNTFLADLTVGGSVTVNSGHGNASGLAGTVTVGNVANTYRPNVIRGNLTFTELDGVGYDLVTDAEVWGNLTFHHGSAAFLTNIDARVTSVPVLVRGNVTVTGTGVNTVVVGVPSPGGGFGKGLGLVVGGNMTVATGGADDTANLMHLRVAGHTWVCLGDGDNSVTVNGSWFPGPFTVQTESGADVVTIGGESVFTNSVSVQTGSGADVVVIDDSVFTGTVNLATGAGPDVVEIETKIGTTASTEFEGPVTISLGADSDALTLGQPETLEGMVVLVDSTFVVHHGTGSDRQFVFDGHVDFPFGTSLQWVV